MKYELQYKRYAENAILIQWPSEIDQNILKDLLFYKKRIENEYNEGIVEVISSYNSLLICYVSTIENIYIKVADLKSLYSYSTSDIKTKQTVFKIPVCYDASLAPDLEAFSKEKHLSISEIISLHTSPIYRVYSIGFLPGFLYLGGLDERLILPRKQNPSLYVKKGAVAIGGSQTGIYPTSSPGGWHVIGMSPLDFFDSTSETPCLIHPGDAIQFMSITEKQYNEISSIVKNGTYVWDKEEI